MNQATTEWTPIISGTPQGSVLGPLLFYSMSTNEIPVLVQSSLKMFADDIKIYRAIFIKYIILIVNGSTHLNIIYKHLQIILKKV